MSCVFLDVRLLEKAAAAGPWQDRDPLIWPALCSFRHYVELELKYLIREFPELGLGVPAPTHRLRKLWPSVAVGFASASGMRIANHSMYLSARSRCSKSSIRLAMAFGTQPRKPVNPR